MALPNESNVRPFNRDSKWSTETVLPGRKSLILRVPVLRYTQELFDKAVHCVKMSSLFLNVFCRVNYCLKLTADVLQRKTGPKKGFSFPF